MYGSQFGTAELHPGGGGKIRMQTRGCERNQSQMPPPTAKTAPGISHIQPLRTGVLSSVMRSQ